MKTNNKCAAVRLEKSKLVAALAILAVAFVVIAAVPAVADDSDAADSTYTDGIIAAGYVADKVTAKGIIDALSDKELQDVDDSTMFAVFQSKAVTGYTLKVNGKDVTSEASKSAALTADVHAIYFKVAADATAQDSVKEAWDATKTYNVEITLGDKTTIKADITGQTVTLYQDVNKTAKNTYEYKFVKADGEEQSLKTVVPVCSDLAINLNDHVLNITTKDDAKVFLVKDEATLKIIGNDVTKSKLNLGGYTGSSCSAICIATDSHVEIEKIGYKTNGSALFPLGSAASVKVTDSSIDAEGYPLGTNNSYSRVNGLQIDISGSTLKSKDSAVMINVKNATMNITDSQIEGTNYALFVRAGTINVVNSTITSENNGIVKTSWGSGMEVTPSTVLVGNIATSDAYSGDARFNMSGGSIIAKTGNAIATTNFDATGKTNVYLAIGVGGFEIDGKKASANATSITCGKDKTAVSIEISDLTYTATSEKNKTVPLLIKTGSVGISGTADGMYLVKGNATIDDNFTLPAGKKLIIAEGATLTITNGAKLIAEDDAIVSVSGTISGEVELNGNATVEIQTGADVSEMKKTGDGSVVDKTSESEMSEMKISGTSETFVGTEPTVFGAKQLITVDGSWTLINGTNIVIKGKLIVPEGATLTIEPGAKLTLDNGAVAQIDGTLVIQPADDGKDNAAEFNVKSGTLELNGAADIKGKLNVNAVSAIVGKVIVGQDASVAVTSDGVLTVDAGAVFEIQKSAVLTINGKIDNGTIQNYGTVVFDAQTANTGKATVNMLASGAVVDVKKFNVASNGDALTITDKDLVLFNIKGTGDQKVGTYSTVKNEITLSYSDLNSDSNASFGSFTVVETLTVKSTTKTSGYGVYDGKSYVNSMDVAGNLAVSASLKDTATGTTAAASTAVSVDSGKKITVSGEITVGTKVTLLFAYAVEADVSGSIDSSAISSTDKTVKATLTNNGEITVSGEGIIKSNAALSATKINAVQYKTGSTPEIYNYVTIDKAIATVSASGNTVKALDVYGKNTVKTTAELPADVTMTVNSGSTVTIGAKAGDDVTLTIAKGAVVKNNGTITVNGVLYALNKSNVKGNAPISDVYSEEMKDGKSVREGWAKWTNVVTALNEAKSGETITISKTGEYVDIKGSIEIKSGVTLVVPAGKAPLKLADGVTLTISGTLTTAEDIYAATMFNVDAKNLVDDKSSAIVVKGVLNADKGTTYNAVRPTAFPAALSAGAPIAGAYYNTEDHTNVISTLEIALTAAKSDITVYGAVTVGDIALTATDDITKITIGNGLKKDIDANTTAKLKAITVKIDTALTVSSVVLGNGAKIEFGIPDVSIDATDATKGIFNGTVTVGDASVEFVGASSNDASSPAVAVVFANESEGKLVLAGKVAVSDKGDKLTIAKGTVYVNNLEVVSINETTSKGAVSIAAGAILEPVKNTSGSNFDALTVEGVLSVPAGTGFTAVTLTVPGTVTVGPSTASTTAGVLNVRTTLYIGMKASDLSTGAGATVSGAISLGTATVYVADGTTLDEDAAASINAMAAKATFHVDGKVWFTAYANSDTTTVKVAKAPVTNAEFAGWATKDGGDVKYGAPTTTTTTTSASAGWNAIPVKGDYYAVINTVIYTVVVNADEGIADVYLNGQAMAYGSIKQGENYVYGYISTVAAGDYKVTYTLKNGWSGDAKLYSNGTALGNNTLSVSGEKGVFNYQLSGVEKSGYVDPTPAPSTDDKDDGLTVTDYLLIVLVVLIVILAVIVAMRLMRS